MPGSNNGQPYIHASHSVTSAVSLWVQGVMSKASLPVAPSLNTSAVHKRHTRMLEFAVVLPKLPSAHGETTPGQAIADRTGHGGGHYLQCCRPSSAWSKKSVCLFACHRAPTKMQQLLPLRLLIFCIVPFLLSVHQLSCSYYHFFVCCSLAGNGVFFYSAALDRKCSQHPEVACHVDDESGESDDRWSWPGRSSKRNLLYWWW